MMESCPAADPESAHVEAEVIPTLERGYEWVTEWVGDAAMRTRRSPIVRAVDGLASGISETKYLEAVFETIDGYSGERSLPLAS